MICRWSDMVGLCNAIRFESPSSWLTRAALSQGITVRDLASHLGWYPAHDLDVMFGTLYRDGLPSHSPALAGLEIARRVLVGYQRSGCSPESLLTGEPRRRSRRPEGLMPTVRKRSQYRFCPVCLDSDPVPLVRQEWRFYCWRYCPKHMCLLEDYCPTCSAPLELPVSLISAGPRKRGVADLSYCTTCGESLALVKVKRLGSIEAMFSGWDSAHLHNGRAAISAMYHGWLRIDGESENRPLQHLRVLEQLAIVPTRSSKG